MNNDSLINNIYINILYVENSFFRKAMVSRNILKNFGGKKKNKNQKHLIASPFPAPTDSERSLVLIKQTWLTVKRLCLAFGNGSW